MTGQQTQSGRSWYLVFIVMPIVALISAIRNFKTPAAKNILWLFAIFYGFTFVISSDNLDSSRYRRELHELGASSITSFNEFTVLLYSNEAEYVDILQPLVTYLVSRFTTDYRILFAVFGLIFGYFYSRNVWQLLSYVETHIKRKALPYIILFALDITIWHINGFRFWTAAHIFFYGFLQANLIGNKWKGMLFCILSLFVHFSFIFPTALYLIYLLVGNRLIVYFILYFASFFISQVKPQTLTTYTSQLPAVFQGRADKYISEEYLNAVEKSKKKSVNWYVTGRVVFLQYTLIFLLLLIFLKHLKWVKSNAIWSSLLCFGLIISIWVNVLGSLPSVGRFSTVSYLFLFAFLFLLIQQSPQRIFALWVQVVVVLAVTLYCVVEVRRGFDTIGLYTILGNPVLALFVENDIPLINLIR